MITQNIVHEIPVTDIAIKAVESMAYEQGFKSLKFKNRRGVIFFDTDWIAGVDYEEEDEDDEYDEEDEPYEYEAEDDELIPEYDNIDPEEVDDLNQDKNEGEQDNPNMHQQNDNEYEDQHPELPEQQHCTMVVSDAEDEVSTATESTRRST